MLSDRMRAQQQNSSLRRFHSTSHRCWTRLRGMCSCLVPSRCRKPGGAYRDSANQCRDLPACSGTLPFEERRGSELCSRSPDYGYAPEGVVLTKVHIVCRPQSLSQYEPEATLSSDRGDQDRQFPPQTHWRTRFVRRVPWWRTARPSTSAPEMRRQVGPKPWLRLSFRHRDAISPTQMGQS